VPVSLYKQQGLLFNRSMKNKAPQAADNSLQGYQFHAIAPMTLDKVSLSQLQEKGKAQNDLSSMQYQLQKVWEVWREENPAVSL